MNIFQTVKENVTARQAAEQYGLKVNKNEMCIRDRKVQYVITNEAGASVYSASKLATEEFPNFDVGQRSAASIARDVYKRQHGCRMEKNELLMNGGWICQAAGT